MRKLLSLTALASAFVLTAAAIAPVSAGHPGGRGYIGRGHYHLSQSRISRPFHPRYLGHLARLRGQDHDHDHHHHHHVFHWRHGSYGGWVYGVPVVAGVGAYEASGPAPAPVCTCLTKEYLDDGAVRFTDTCTRETAIAMPPVPAPRG